jgi:NAD(P)-dependent dehydrogenase (short-subunit alcohol dehydrogenase family)
LRWLPAAPAVPAGASRSSWAPPARTVYVTGRTTRTHRSEYGRPETIEETAELVSAAGGQGIAVQADHLVAEEVRTLVDRIRATHRRLDILVNDLWGGEDLKEWNKAVWEHDLANGLRLLSLGVHTHLITAHFALPLLIERPGGLLVEVTDGTAEYNADHYRINPFYDLAKVAVTRMAWAHAQDLAGMEQRRYALLQDGCVRR